MHICDVCNHHRAAHAYLRVTAHVQFLFWGPSWLVASICHFAKRRTRGDKKVSHLGCFKCNVISSQSIHTHQMCLRAFAINIKNRHSCHHRSSPVRGGERKNTCQNIHLFYDMQQILACFREEEITSTELFNI